MLSLYRSYRTTATILISLCALNPAMAMRIPVPVPPIDAPAWSATDSGAAVVHGDGADYVRVALAAPTHDAHGYLLPLPMAIVRGSIVEVSVETRVSHVSAPSASYNGVKVMLHVAYPAVADTYDHAPANGTAYPLSYDWKRVTFRSRVPLEARAATLLLGLQGSSGTADFRLPSITIVRLAAERLHDVKVARPWHDGGTPPATLRGVMVSPLMKAADIDSLQAWNVNLIRWQLKYNGPPLETDGDEWLDHLLGPLDALLPAFKRAGISVVIDLHRPPTSPMGATVLSDPTMQRRFVRWWKILAARYRDEKGVWGYDLLNEPTPADAPESALSWRDLAEETAQEIRGIDHDHVIIVEPDPEAIPDTLEFFQPLDVPGVVYSVHMYVPFAFTHQGVRDYLPTGQAYPGMIDGVVWDKVRLGNYLKPLATYSARFHAPIYIGEFGAARWAPGADQWLTDAISVFEENHWNWSFHAFREFQGWNPEIGDDKSVTRPSSIPTSRLLALQTALARNGKSE